MITVYLVGLFQCKPLRKIVQLIECKIVNLAEKSIRFYKKCFKTILLSLFIYFAAYNETLMALFVKQNKVNGFTKISLHLRGILHRVSCSFFVIPNIRK